ncbi:MAG: sulfotransferase family protein [Solirubrobacteraceae bacterium]|jgi:hypothetical protein
MELIAAGLPRTATSTQLVALEKLGFTPCYHMRDVLADLEHSVPLWEAVVEGNPDWDAIFGDSRACGDFPAGRYYRELLDYYPGSKVLLSVREPAGFVKSMRATVWACYFGPSLLCHMSLGRAAIDPLWERYLAVMTKMLWAEGGALYGDTFDDDAFGKLMLAWNERVKRDVPADRLLVWEPAQGWGPLCEFLEVPVPDEPLPHVNDQAGFLEGLIGQALAKINAFWDARERPKTGLHGAALDD